MTELNKSNKIAVYAICKNEIKYVDEWMKSVREADYVIVLDTGSEDGTQDRLRELGATVYEATINPWRFDAARNEALKLVPSDANILVSVDLDELFDRGWSKWLRNNWKDSFGMLRYYYVQDHLQDGSDGVVFYRDKIHLNDYDTYHWIYSIHEVLTRPEDQAVYFTEDIRCHHWQDKSKSRTNYLKLLEQEYALDSEDARNLHLLGREYTHYKEFDKSIRILNKLIYLYEGSLVHEIGDAYGLIGSAYIEQKDYDEAVVAFKRASRILPFMRGPHLDLANTYLLQLRFHEALFEISKAFEIKDQYKIWNDDPLAWREKPYALAYEAFMGIKDYKAAEACLENIRAINPQFELLDALSERHAAESTHLS